MPKAKAAKRGAKKAPPPKHDRDYENMLLLNLKVLCKERGISVTGMNKADIVKALHKNDAKTDRSNGKKKGKKEKKHKKDSSSEGEEEEEVEESEEEEKKSKKSKKTSRTSEDDTEEKPKKSKKASHTSEDDAEEKPKKSKKSRKVSSEEEEPEEEDQESMTEETESTSEEKSRKTSPKERKVKESAKSSKVDDEPIVLRGTLETKSTSGATKSTSGVKLNKIRETIEKAVNSLSGSSKLDLFIKHTEEEKEEFVNQLFFGKVAIAVANLEEEGDSASEIRKRYDLLRDAYHLPSLPSEVSEDDIMDNVSVRFLEYYMGPREKQRQCLSIFKGNEEAIESRIAKLYADLRRKIGVDTDHQLKSFFPSSLGERAEEPSVSREETRKSPKSPKESVSRMDISEPSPLRERPRPEESPAKKPRTPEPAPRFPERRKPSPKALERPALKGRKTAISDLFGSESSSSSEDKTHSGNLFSSASTQTPPRKTEDPREISRSESSEELVVSFPSAPSVSSPRSPKNVIVNESPSKKGDSPRVESGSVSITWSSKYSTYVVEHDENTIAMNLAGGNRDAYAAIVDGKFVPIDDNVAKYLDKHLGITSSKNLNSKEIKRIRESQALPEESESTSSSSSEEVDLIKRDDQFLNGSKSIIKEPTPQEKELFERYKKYEDRDVARKMNSTISRVRFLRQKL